MFEVCSNYLALAISRFCTSVAVGPAMSQCLFSSVPTLSFIYVKLMMVLSMLFTDYDDQLNAVHDFNL